MRVGSDKELHFKTDTIELFSFSPVSTTTRELAIQDLYRALLTSNNDIIKQYDIHKHILKSTEELYEIALSTEQSMYDEMKAYTKLYLETLITYLVFLTDKTLMNDAVIFRFLINVDITNLYTEPPDIIFTELLYSDIDVEHKRKYLHSIVSSIEDNVNYILLKVLSYAI